MKRSVDFVWLGEDDVAKLLKDVGVAADKENLKVMIEKLKGKEIHELVAAGMSKFASIPSGGAAAPSSAAPRPFLPVLPFIPLGQMLKPGTQAILIIPLLHPPYIVMSLQQHFGG